HRSQAGQVSRSRFDVRAAAKVEPDPGPLQPPSASPFFGQDPKKGTQESRHQNDRTTCWICHQGLKAPTRDFHGCDTAVGAPRWVLDRTHRRVAMSTAQVSSEASENASVKNVDMKLEVVTIPVSDMERATEFYVGLGWRQDVTPPGSGIVQLT